MSCLLSVSLVAWATLSSCAPFRACGFGSAWGAYGGSSSATYVHTRLLLLLPSPCCDDFRHKFFFHNMRSKKVETRSMSARSREVMSASFLTLRLISAPAWPEVDMVEIVTFVSGGYLVFWYTLALHDALTASAWLAPLRRQRCCRTHLFLEEFVGGGGGGSS